MNNSIVTRALLVFFLIGITMTGFSCHTKEKNAIVMNSDTAKIEKAVPLTPFDSTLIKTFFVKYPNLIQYKKQVVTLYRKQQFNYIWFDGKGKKETAAVINDKINNLDKEGLEAKVPYKEVFDTLFEKDSDKPNADLELFLTTYYFYYTDKVLQGIDASKSKETGWYLPRKKQSYVSYLDSILADPSKMEEKHLINQYYKLRDVLQLYRNIEKKGGWATIVPEPGFVSYKINDTSKVIAEIRTRLFLTGDISTNSKSPLYDEVLKEGILKFKKRTGYAADGVILPKHIAEMNISVSDRIKTIVVNMERCRWISKDLTKSKEFIVINIPSFKLTYFKNEKPVLVSNVVVGKVMNKTVIFSGMMSYIVFCPYWNVPTSILKKEILPAIQKNKNYLSKHDMEWHNGGVRQKPGHNNSLGLIKFLFPNSNNIYLHDTPSKNLFNSETRAFSHGCIRVEKPKELANLILKDDPKWTPQKIEEAMGKNKESWYALKNKIPVYIGYFTSWVDQEGTVNFYKDIYDLDARLADMIVE